MTIKHIIIGGGGPIGFAIYGALKELNINKFWDLKNIETIYATSIGAFIALIISLDYEWRWIDDYLIKRPWEPILESISEEFLSYFNQKGIFDCESIRMYIEPLLTAKNFTMDMTLSDFNKLTGKDIHMFSVNFNSPDLECVDISYKTHPDLDLLTALSMTMAVPILFKPVLYKDGCYLDGGITNNLPIQNCLDNTKCDLSEMLIITKADSNPTMTINDETQMLDYITILIKKLHTKLHSKSIESLDNTVYILMNDYSSMDKWYSAIIEQEIREEIINYGISAARVLLNKDVNKDVECVEIS